MYTGWVDAGSAKPTNRTMSMRFGLGSVSGRVFEDKVCVEMPDGSAQLEEVGFLQRGAAVQRESRGRAASSGSGQACTSISFL